MANFIPLKNYMFYCLDKLIATHKLTYPFLDVGCGIGDSSKYLAQKGWTGSAIDSSESAIAQAKLNLKQFNSIQVTKRSLFEEVGSYQTILLWDVLEHINEDQVFLEKLSSLLAPGGHLLIAVPSNPKEWGWDDDFYGHYRRYTKKEMSEKLVKAGLSPVVFWDFTFPVFWIMRRLYILIKSPRKNSSEVKEERTDESAVVNAWDIPLISNILNKENFIWRFIYKMQFNFFKNKITKGHEFFVLAQKVTSK